MSEKTAFADGAWAHDDGQGEDRNPYESGTRGFADWRDGWADARRHAAGDGDPDDE